MPQPWEQFQSQAQPVAQQPWEQFTPQDFASRTARDLTKRWQEGQAAADDYVAGKITYPEMMLASTGKVVAGAGNDIIGEAAKSAAAPLQAIGEAVTPKAISEPMAKLGQDIKNYVSDSAVGDVARQYAGNVGDFMQAHPRLTRNVESAANIATFVPTATGIVKTAQAIPGAVNDVKEAVGGAYRAQFPEAITAEQVRKAGSNAYKAVEDSGTVFAPTVTDKALDIIQSAKQKPLFNGTVLPKESADINAALEEFLPARGQPMSMADLQGLDSNLGDKAAQAYITGNANKARVISDVQDKIREMLQKGKLGAQDVIAGSPEGADILTNHAIPLWSTQAKMQDIEKIFEKARYTQNPATSIQTGLKNLMFSKRFATYPEEVQKIIRKGAEGSISDDMLGIIGSRLNVIAGEAVGGPSGAAAAYATSAAGRGVRTALKNRQANKVIGSLAENVRPSIDRFANYTTPPVSPAAPFKPYGLLPAPESTISVNQYGQAVPITPATRDVLGQQATQSTIANIPLQQIMQMKPEDARAALESYMRNKNFRR